MQGIAGEITINRVGDIIEEQLNQLEIKFIPQKQVAVLQFKCRQTSSAEKFRNGYFLYCVRVAVKNGRYRLEHLPDQPFFKRNTYLFEHKDQLYYMEHRGLKNEIQSSYKKYGRLSALGEIRPHTHELYRLDFEYAADGSIGISSTLCSSFEFDYTAYLNGIQNLHCWLGLPRLTDEDKEALRAKNGKCEYKGGYCDKQEFMTGPYGILLVKINRVWRLVRI